MSDASGSVRSRVAASDLRLASGSRVGVVGGGPAGSFFSFFLLQIAERVGLELQVDVFEPKDYLHPGPTGCNMCGGIISESLLQHLATEGINLPNTVIQRRIDSYVLHMDIGSVRIETPLNEKRIAAVHRGSGPRDAKADEYASFDGYLLQLALDQGARHRQQRVTGVSWNGGRPQIRSQDGSVESYDLLVAAVGVNSPALKLFAELDLPFAPPRTSRTYISEFRLGQPMIKRYLGSSMHVFLLDLPRLEFAAIIPKSDYATVCLLGDDIDKQLVEAFLSSPQVKGCMPPQWRAPQRYCHCSPKINIASARQPFADRLVFVGDCGTSRLYKDGIGAAYRTAKAAAITAVFEGISASAFKAKYLPACKAISSDNDIGKLIFFITRQIQKRRFARRGVSQMVVNEQQKAGPQRRMSLVLWDTFTGSAPYKSVFKRSLHPAFLGGLSWAIASANVAALRKPRRRRDIMPIPSTGFVGKRYKEGDIIFRQGDREDCMYVIQKGQVEIFQRQDDKEFCIATLEDGDFFGEMALFGDEVRSTTVRAASEVWVLSLQKQSLLRRIHDDPSLAFRMMSKMAHRIRELEAAMVSLGARNLDIADAARQGAPETPTPAGSAT